MKLTEIISLLENNDPRIRPFSRDNLPRTMQALAVQYPSGRIEVYKVNQFFVKEGKLSLLGDLRVRRFNNKPKPELDNYKTKQFQAIDFIQCRFYYF